MRVLAFAEAKLPGALRSQVQQLTDAAWPEPAKPDERSRLHDPTLDPYILLIIEDSRVVATLAILRKQFTHAGRLFAAAGLSAVTTREDVRGHGYGQCIVASARERIISSDVDLGIFTCDKDLQGFYERAGWHNLPGTVIVGGTSTTPFRSDQPGMAKVTMGLFVSAHARALQHTFHHADIALYPGEIDKLW